MLRHIRSILRSSEYRSMSNSTVQQCLTRPFLIVILIFFVFFRRAQSFGSRVIDHHILYVRLFHFRQESPCAFGYWLLTSSYVSLRSPKAPRSGRWKERGSSFPRIRQRTDQPQAEAGLRGRDRSRLDARVRGHDGERGRVSQQERDKRPSGGLQCLLTGELISNSFPASHSHSTRAHYHIRWGVTINRRARNKSAHPPPNRAGRNRGQELFSVSAEPLDFPLHPGAERYYREKGYF